MDRCWKDVTVGDFIHLSCNEVIPADMVLLFSTDPDGICHIETSGLDGESNLKQKQVVRRYAEQVKNVFSAGDINIFFLQGGNKVHSGGVMSAEALRPGLSLVL